MRSEAWMELDRLQRELQDLIYHMKGGDAVFLFGKKNGYGDVILRIRARKSAITRRQNRKEGGK